jgi:hypothetical protein
MNSKRNGQLYEVIPLRWLVIFISTYNTFFLVYFVTFLKEKNGFITRNVPTIHVFRLKQQ